MRNKLAFILALAIFPATAATFVGTTPPAKLVREIMGVPAGAESVEWELTLNENDYSMKADYKVPRDSKVKPGTVKRSGSLKMGRGAKSNSDAAIYELEGLLNLMKVSDNVLHALDRDRALMVGHGGWSYSLYNSKATEKLGNREIAMARTGPDGYTNSPLSSGPMVLGVFEGRTPCHGISRAMKCAVDEGCIKAKWRVTLFHDPTTKKPTTYKIDGSRYRGIPREGKWSIDGNAYILEATSKEGTMVLLKGDDNVLFIADEKRHPLVGHAEFGYTLNRRPPEGFPLED